MSNTHLLPFHTGFFVDWDGNTRRVEAPGDGFTCRLTAHNAYTGVDVIDHALFICYEAVYYETIEALEAAGVKVNLI